MTFLLMNRHAAAIELSFAVEVVLSQQQQIPFKSSLSSIIIIICIDQSAIV